MHKHRRLLRALGALVFLFGLAGQSAFADGSVSSLQMGYGARTPAEFAHFQDVIAQFNASGERFRIDSHCQSACTMFLSIHNVCVTPDASLWFHAGGSRRKGINPVYTQMMFRTYKATLQQYITANHFMDTLDFHSIPVSVIISFGYPACR